MRSHPLNPATKLWRAPYLFRAASIHIRLGNRSLGSLAEQIMTKARQIVPVRSAIGALFAHSTLLTRLFVVSSRKPQTATCPHAERAGQYRLPSEQTLNLHTTAE